MKRIIIILLSAFALTACNHKVNAQSVALYQNTDSTSSGTVSTVTSVRRDTLWDANTLYTMYTKGTSLMNTTGSKYLVTFDVTKIDGTGTAIVYLQVSHDGVTWRNANLSSKGAANTRVPVSGTDGLGSDSLSIAAASTTALKYAYYHVPNSPYTYNGTTVYVAGGKVNYARLKIVGSGTQRTIYSNAQITVFN